MGRSVVIFDTTLRDGEQSPGVSLTVQEKVEIARQLARLGVDVIEVGFPVTSPGDMEASSACAREVREPVICALARAVPRDIELAWHAVRGARRPRIHTFIATSEIHMRHKLKKTPDEVLAMTRQAVSLARSYVDDVEFSAEDATRSDPDFLVRVFQEAVMAGATVLNVPDTVGYSMPDEFGELVELVVRRVAGPAGVPVSVHCHNDLGLACANTLAGLAAGATQAECTVNGIGERAGNAALEEIAMLLRTRGDRLGLSSRIVTEQIARTSRLVSSLTGMTVQPNKAVVGRNAFAHESGIHQDGVLKERTTYEIMTPESVGLTTSDLVLGKHSGRHAFAVRLAELGYSLRDEDVERAYARFKTLADRKKNITDRDLEAIIDEGLVVNYQPFRLEHLKIVCVTGDLSTATVRISGPGLSTGSGSDGGPAGGGHVEEAACGSGPVEAACKAIDRALGCRGEIVDYSLTAASSGKDALGEASVRVRFNGTVVSGRGVSTDVVEASARAYLSAYNRLRAMAPAAPPRAAEGPPEADGTVSLA